MRPVRTIIFLLVCLGLLLLAFLMLKSIFSTDSSNSSQTQTAKLATYAHSGTSAQYVIDGPIVQNQVHRKMKVTVDAESSKIELMEGYSDTVVSQEVYPNTQESYRNFLAGLDTLGFSKGVKDSSDTRETGKCPLGKRYVYSLQSNNNDVFRYWSTSCGHGTFEGQDGSVETLFSRQIPSRVYNEITRQFNARN